MIKRTTHILCLIFCLLPFIYLAMIWKTLPQEVPIHFNFEGQPDNYADRSFLWFMPGMLSFFIYLLMIFIPLLDPKGKLNEMAQKYNGLVLLIIGFMSILSLYILYITNSGSFSSPKIIFGLIGVLFAILGNFMPTMKPNYFMGVRTPWTLENEVVWRKTHLLSGRLWMAGGVLIIIFAIVPGSLKVFITLFVLVIIILTLIPIIFSYVYYKEVITNNKK